MSSGYTAVGTGRDDIVSVIAIAIVVDIAIAIVIDTVIDIIILIDNDTVMISS